MKRAITLLAVLLSGAYTGHADEGAGLLAQIEVSGFVAAELRAFVEGPKFRGQLSHSQPSLILEPEFRLDASNRAHRFEVVPFLRLDGQDDKRTHADMREAFWRYSGTAWDVLIGLNRVFFGVTESRHLVNIINQVDQVEDIDEEDFLGQPMINASTQQDWGQLDFYIMTGFRKRTFAGTEGRLRTALLVDEDDASFDSDLDEWQPELLTRYSHNIGDWDLGVYYFHGTSREPVLTSNEDGTELRPHYDLINQLALDLQLTHEATLYKLEGIVREGQGDVFSALVMGFEHTLFQIFGTNADLGLLVEYLYDERDEDAPATIYDDDVFFGTRLALNDVQDSGALLGIIIDMNNSSTSLRLEAERRIGDWWKVELESQWFANVDDNDPLWNFEKDSFIALTIRRSY